MENAHIRPPKHVTQNLIADTIIVALDIDEQPSAIWLQIAVIGAICFNWYRRKPYRASSFQVIIMRHFVLQYMQPHEIEARRFGKQDPSSPGVQRHRARRCVLIIVTRTSREKEKG